MPASEVARRRAAASFPWKAFLAHGVLSLAAWTSLVLLVDPAFADGSPLHGEYGIALRNALPCAVLGAVLLAVTRRFALSLWLCGLLVGATYAVNALKLRHLRTPLLPMDFSAAAQNLGHGVLGHFVPRDSAAVLACAAAVLVAVVLALRERPLAGLRRVPRAILFAVGAALGGTLLAGAAPWDRLYARELLDFQPWAPRYSMDHAGLVAGLLRYRWEMLEPAVVPPPAAAAELLQRRCTAPTPVRAELPDIVVVQAEAFSDPARIDGIDAATTLPNYRRLAQRAVHGDLWVPTFGGGTIRTEFEVLTGLGLRFFPADMYPYFRLVRARLPGLVSALARHGYRRIALHPNDPTFWNREWAFDALGFEEFDSMNGGADLAHDGRHASDDALVERILERLPASGPPTFVFAITMEGHAPYDAEAVIDPARRDAWPLPPGLDAVATTELRHYLYHIENADRALGRLADALARRPRRALLLFYGDHLAALPTVYDRLGLKDTRTAMAQPVPWLLFDSAASTSARVDTAAFFLPGQLLAAAGIGDVPWFRLTESIRADTTVDSVFEPADAEAFRDLSILHQLGHDRALFRAEPRCAAPAGAAPVR